jgi:hypothetical protein
LFPVRAPAIETTSVVDGSQEMTLAEAQTRLEQTTEADLLRDALTYQRGSVVGDFYGRADELRKCEVLPNPRNPADAPSALAASGMEKLFRRAGVLAGSEEGLGMLLSKYAAETARCAIIRAEHDHRKHIELRNVVASKVLPASLSLLYY